MLDGGGTGLIDFAVAALSYNIAAGAVNTLAPSPHAWRVQATTLTGGGPVTTSNSMSLYCDRVEITDVEIINGGGVSTAGAPNRQYYRARNLAGAQIRLTARMQQRLCSVIGNTTVRIRDVTEGVNYDVVIPNGVATGVLNIAPYPLTPGAPDSTLAHTYQAITISGGVCENAQNIYGRILQPGNNGGSDTVVRWDYLDPPGLNANPFNGGAGLSSTTQTANSITLSWPALANADPDRDFFTYRIYYKKSTDATWTMIDRNTSAAYTSLGTITTSGITVTGLEPLTSYDFRLSAVDIFGNEVIVANQPTSTVSTNPFQIDITISDGIDNFAEVSFDNGDPASHPLRETAIKITVYLITAGNDPDAVNIIVANNDSDLPAQHGVTGTNDDITGLTDGVGRWTIGTSKSEANTWITYLPTTNPLVKMGTSIRFIVESIYGGAITYSDHTDESSPPGDHSSDEWRFKIATPAVFIPWPTRILNNVMTSRLPCCYPAYFLTFDALVTMKVYDVKGRVVATLLDRVYRKGGQNIKENGWCGYNKYNKRLGPGLYYIHIKAVTFGNRVILNKFKKVVIAR